MKNATKTKHDHSLKSPSLSSSPDSSETSPFDGDDKSYINVLRPEYFDQYVGQTHLVLKLKIAIEAAKKRQENIDHVILHGGSGLGKTTIANIIAKEYSGGKPVSISAGAIKKTEDVSQILCGLTDGDILFIDEIHCLKRSIQEMLLCAMEDYAIEVRVAKEKAETVIRIPVAKFTLIGATTEIGKLVSPLLSRFGICHEMEPYTEAELFVIAKASSQKLQMNIDDKSIADVVQRSRGVPRMVNRLLKRVRDCAEVMNNGKVNKDILEKTFSIEQIDPEGLTLLDRKYLTALRNQSGRAGVNALSAVLNVDPETISGFIEPFLASRGYIVRSSKGRVLTQKAWSRFLKPKTKE